MWPALIMTDRMLDTFFPGPAWTSHRASPIISDHHSALTACEKLLELHMLRKLTVKCLSCHDALYPQSNAIPSLVFKHNDVEDDVAQFPFTRDSSVSALCCFNFHYSFILNHVLQWIVTSLLGVWIPLTILCVTFDKMHDGKPRNLNLLPKWCRMLLVRLIWEDWLCEEWFNI